MYSRVGNIKHNGNTEEIIEKLRSQKAKYDAMEGLLTVIYIKISDREFLGIPVWESKEAFQNAESQVQELMSMFKDKMDSPPEFKEGEVVWQYLKES
tara:strand:+ start:580 stop:870 length:291 start_codon:yes stop_codon:yes gene_type:complete